MNHLFLYVLLGGLSFWLTSLAVPLARKWAFRFRVVDFPRDRRVHSGIVPRVGGIAMFTSVFSLTLAVAYTLKYEHLVPMLFLGALAFAIGVLDDVFALRPKQKLYAQLLLGAVTYFAGFRLNQVALGEQSILPLPSALSFFCTVFWVVVVMNSINLIDGINGLAGGVSLLILSAIGFLALGAMSAHVALLVFLMMGALLGFLRFNFSKATIFMGDSGSLTLGYFIGLLSLSVVNEFSPSLPIYVPLLLVSLPLLDLCIAILRRSIRLIDQRPVNQSLVKLLKKICIGIMIADGDHIHHRLLRRYDGSHRKVALVSYLITAIGATTALISAFLPPALGWLCVAGFVYFVTQFVLSLEYDEFLPKDLRAAKQEAAFEKALKAS